MASELQQLPVRPRAFIPPIRPCSCCPRGPTLFPPLPRSFPPPPVPSSGWRLISWRDATLGRPPAASTVKV